MVVEIIAEGPMTTQETEEEKVDSTLTSTTEMKEEEVNSTSARLYKAIHEKNWATVQAIVENNSSALSAKLTSKGSTALHVAALFGHVDIVEKLVNLVPQECLEDRSACGYTPLTIAISTGIIRVAKCMVNKNKKILSIPVANCLLPVSFAFATGHKEMARYLYTVTPLEDLKLDKGHQGPRLLYYCFNSGNLDIALHLLQRCENLLFAKDRGGWTLIKGIAAMPFAFPSGSQLVFWKRWIYKCQ